MRTKRITKQDKINKLATVILHTIDTNNPCFTRHLVRTLQDLHIEIPARIKERLKI